MSVVIEGRKAGQKQPKRPSIADDTIASISRLKALYLLSAGEVKGLANGAASIMLEGTPLVDDNGTPNFDGVEWEIRHGTVDQPHIAGMPSASNEIGVNVQLPSDTPYIRSISNTQLSSINVNISFPMLKKQKDNGDIVGVTVAYAIDVQTDGGGYVTMLNTSLTAKTSGRYQKTHNVKLPDAQSNWQIRVRKITADGNNETLFNSMQVDSIAEIIDAKLRYPCSALLYLSFDAKTFSNIPKLSVDMQGVYVQVPSNYDTVTRTSTGIWDGTFKQGYTTNPAWHYYDLITNKRYGLGDKIKPFMINKWALEHIARVCDEPVDDGKGGTEPRFTCNLYLQKAEDAYQVLQHIAGIFRGMSFWNGSQIVVDADTARDCEYVITRANVVGGAFVKTGSAASDRHTIAKVAWSNPDNAYETEYVMVRNEQAITEFGINILDLSAVGCTSEGQAYRMGLAALLAELNRTQTVSFAMGLDGELPAIGSRIDIADMMFTGANNGGRISSVSDNRQVITVDRDNVPANVGDKLIVNLESGKAQERVITAISGRDITVAIAFDPVASQNVWAVNTAEMPTMPFIVMSAVQDDDGKQFNYTAMQYDPTIYSQIDNGTIIEQRPVIPGNNPYVIDMPDNVVITSRNRVEQGQNVSTLVIAWTQVKDAVAYDVEWRKDDGDWIKLPRTGNISAEIDGVYSGNYLARVRAVSAFDAISKPTSSTLTGITGKVGTPPQLATLTATGLLFGMQIDWTFSTGSGDTAYTEIQVGSAPDVNVTTLGQFAYNTDTHTVSGLQGNLAQSYRGRIVDKLGNVSPWTPWVTGTTDANADKVMDLIQGQIDESALDTILKEKIDGIQINKEAISQETDERIQAIIDANKKTALAQQAADAASGAASSAQQAADAAQQTADTATTELVNIAADNKLTPVEKKQLVTIKEEIDKTDTGIRARAAKFNVPVSAYNTAYNALNSYIAPKLADLTTTSTIVRTAFDSKFSDLYQKRAELDTAITTAAEKASADAQAAADSAQQKADQNEVNFIQFEEDTSNEFVAQGEKLDGIIADYKPRYADKTRYADASSSRQWTYWKTVAADNYAANQRITNLQSEFNDSNANVTNELFTLTEKDKSIAADVTQLYSETGENFSLIQEIDLAISTPETGLAAKVTELQSSVNDPDNLASLVEGSGAFNDEFESISGQFTNFEAVVEGQKTAMEVISGIGNAERLKNEIAKARLDKDVTNLNAQSVALTTQIDGYTTKIADVTAKRDATSDTDLKAEYDKLITDLTAAKDDLTAQKAVIADQVTQLAAEKKVLDDFKEVEDGVRAQHTVKVDNEGKIVGFGLVLQDDGFSAFDVRADRFSISAPVGKPNDIDGNSPFMVLTTPQNIDGVQVPAGTYMRNFYAPRGSIDTLQVKDGAIKSAQIDDLAVTEGKIANLAVDTLQIKNNAVIVPRVQNFSDDVVLNDIDTGYTFGSITLDAQGGSVTIQTMFTSLAVFRPGGDAIEGAVYIDTMRGGARIDRFRIAFVGNNTYTLATTPVTIDTPPAGSHTYSVRVWASPSSGTPVLIFRDARSIHVMGAKR